MFARLVVFENMYKKITKIFIYAQILLTMFIKIFTLKLTYYRSFIMKRDVYSFFTDGLEVYNMLRDAKAAGENIKVKVEDFGNVTTLKSSDDPSVWREYFYCKSEADVVDRFVSKPKLAEKKKLWQEHSFLKDN